MASPGNQHCANCIGTLSFPLNRDNNTLREYARLLSHIPDNTTDAMIETAKLQLVTIKEFYNRLLIKLTTNYWLISVKNYTTQIGQNVQIFQSMNKTQKQLTALLFAMFYPCM